MAIKPLEDRRLLGISFILVGYLCFTIIDACAKFLVQAGMPSMEAMRPADTREAKDSEPAEKKEETKKPSAFDILRGVIGR